MGHSEYHRRLALCRAIFINHFLPGEERKEASKNYLALITIARARGLAFGQTIGVIADTLECSENKFIADHAEKIFILASYLVNGSTRLEELYSSIEDREKATEIQNRFNKKVCDYNFNLEIKEQT